MGRSRIFVFFFYFLFSLNSFATSFSISGVSKESVIDGNTVKVYAGWSNPANCTSTDGVNACDSCTTSTPSMPCNKASIYSTLYFQITVDSGAANINGLPVQASTSSSLESPINGVSSVVSGSQYTFKIYWSTLCPLLGSNTAGVALGADCGASSGPSFATKTIYIGPVKDAKFVETITVEINISASATNTVSNYTRCPEGVQATTTAEGVGCDYAVFPGDNKVYLDKFYHTWNTDSPATQISAPVAAIAMFAKAASHTFAQAQSSPSLDVNVLKTVYNSSDYYRLPVQAGTSPIEELKMEDLNNDQRYCFIMATEDVTGNIGYFTSESDYSTIPTNPLEANALNLCATPSQVIGLLGDKSCFIATAAFGSSLEAHVQKFREFRNKFLLVNDWGRAFVRFYYKHSPPLAHWISHRDWARKMTRSLLWPAAVFVEITYQWGLGWALIFSFALVYLFIRALQKIRRYYKLNKKGRI